MFLVKLIGNGVIVAGLLMLLGGASFIGATTTALALTLIAYLLGDLIILPKTNNAVATAADAFLAFMLLWGISRTSGWEISIAELILIVAVLGVFEYIFHTMLYRTGYFSGARKIRF